MAKKLISYDDTKPGTGLPQAVETRIDGRYATKAELQSAVGGIEGVVSSSISRIVTYKTGDPLPETSDGDLVIEYIGGQQFFDDFTSGIGADWVERMGDGWWSVVDDATAQGGKALRSAPTSVSPRVLSHTPTDSSIGYPEQVEILARIKGNYSAQAVNTGIGARLSGMPGAVSGVILSVLRTGLRVTNLNSGSQTFVNASFTPPSGEWVNLRLRLDGGLVHAKGWVDGTPEPEEWMISTTTALTTGWVGMYSFGSSPQTWDFISIATGGMTAVDEEVTP